MSTTMVRQAGRAGATRRGGLRLVADHGRVIGDLRPHEGTVRQAALRTAVPAGGGVATGVAGRSENERRRVAAGVSARPPARPPARPLAQPPARAKRPPVRLTRRGRLVVTVALALLVAAGSMALGVAGIG